MAFGGWFVVRIVRHEGLVWFGVPVFSYNWAFVVRILRHEGWFWFGLAGLCRNCWFVVRIVRHEGLFWRRPSVFNDDWVFVVRILRRKPPAGARARAGESGAPGRIRTGDLRLRRTLLYPTELLGRRSGHRSTWHCTHSTRIRHRLLRRRASPPPSDPAPTPKPPLPAIPPVA